MNDLVNMLDGVMIGIDVGKQLINCLLFADDIALIAETEEELQRLLDDVDKISEVRVMVLNATFNNISVISWRSVLLVEDLEKTSDLPQVPETWTTLLHNVVSSTSCWYRVKWAPGQFDTCLNSQIVRLF